MPIVQLEYEPQPIEAPRAGRSVGVVMLIAASLLWSVSGVALKS